MSYFLETSNDPSSVSNDSNDFNDLNKTRFLSAMSKKCDRCMILELFVNGSTSLQHHYEQVASAHNLKLIDQEYVDAGFDLYSPEEMKCSVGEALKVNFNIQCASYMVNLNIPHSEFPTGYHLYARSSLAKTSLRLANSVGIIDSGYRGNIIGMFDCINADYVVKPFDRLVQICAPSLVPIFVKVVRNVEELGMTARGSGGFGSSGR